MMNRDEGLQYTHGKQQISNLMMSNNTILISEDHPMISIMLSEMIEELLGNQTKIVVTNSLNSTQMLEIKPDLVFVDLNLPDSIGLNTIAAFQRLFPKVHKVICSGSLDDSTQRAAELAGFQVVNKASPYPDLLAALERALIKVGMLKSFRQQTDKTCKNEFHSNIYAPGGDKPLTLKQVEIMKLTSDGYSAKEVAERLGIRPDTVRGHMKEIFVRLGAKNKGQAVEIFVRAERKAKLLDS